MKIIKLIRKNFITLLFASFMLFLLIYSYDNLVAARNGLKLFANNVIPSLFPFFVAVELLSHTSIIYYLSRLFHKFMKPFFNVPDVAVFPLIMGAISGYPIGAKVVTNLYEKKLISKKDAERVLAFTNNSGPLFILGTVGTAFFGNYKIGLILLITHILAALTTGIIFGKLYKNNTSNKHSFFSKRKNSIYDKSDNDFDYTKFAYLKNDISFTELGTVLSDSVLSSIKSILNVGGFVVLFSVIISILNKTEILVNISSLIANAFHINSNLVEAFITGIIEFTNGLSNISKVDSGNLSINVILSAFILGFGGISVTLQAVSIFSRAKLSGKYYILGKITQAFIASFYTFLALNLFVTF